MRFPRESSKQRDSSPQNHDDGPWDTCQAKDSFGRLEPDQEPCGTDHGNRAWRARATAKAQGRCHGKDFFGSPDRGGGSRVRPIAKDPRDRTFGRRPLEAASRSKDPPTRRERTPSGALTETADTQDLSHGTPLAVDPRVEGARGKRQRERRAFSFSSEKRASFGEAPSGVAQDAPILSPTFSRVCQAEEPASHHLRVNGESVALRSSRAPFVLARDQALRGEVLRL